MCSETRTHSLGRPCGPACTVTHNDAEKPIRHPLRDARTGQVWRLGKESRIEMQLRVWVYRCCQKARPSRGVPANLLNHLSIRVRDVWRNSHRRQEEQVGSEGDNQQSGILWAQVNKKFKKG